MAGKNVQGTGKARPNPMVKSHAGLGSHKKVYKSHAAAKAQAAGSPETTVTAQP